MACEGLWPSSCQPLGPHQQAPGTLASFPSLQRIWVSAAVPWGPALAMQSPSMEADLDLAHLFSAPWVLLGPCLPTEPQWRVHSPPFHSFIVLSPTTFSFPLFQPPNAMATLGPRHLLGWPHFWKVPCRHCYSKIQPIFLTLSPRRSHDTCFLKPYQCHSASFTSCVHFRP